MMITLHKNARTTPAIRAESAASTESAAALAERFSLTQATVHKWKKRDNIHDRSHTAHRLQTTLSTAQEAIVVHLRQTLLLPLDDLLAVNSFAKTNAMVECFNGRIDYLISGEDMAQTLTRYAVHPSFTASTLKSKTSMQTMKQWCSTHPHLLHKKPYDCPECDSYI